MNLQEETNRDELLNRAGVSPERLAHIVFRTAQFQTMRDFYINFLNARVAYENDLVCFLRYDDEHHRVVILAVPGLSPVQHRAAGLEHFAFSYGTLGELLGNYIRLKARDIKPDWCINHGMTTSIYYRDPDGNQIETQFDNMDMPSADAFIASGYFDRNPIGVDFDPEVLLARYQSGDPLAELVRFKSAPYSPDTPHIRPIGMPPYDSDGALI